ncbi:MAG: hypothetical protein ABEH56_00815 [Salinirussus sp.]
MDPSADEIAGVTDQFGALTREELATALAELAFKRGDGHDPSAFEADIDAAIRSYHLVAVEDAGTAETTESLLVTGPAAFPVLPEGGADLPHIMDVPDRRPGAEAVAEAAERQFRADAAAAVETGESGRIADLLDLSYELEAWGPVDLHRTRERLDDAREDSRDGPPTN